jgi:hypothetical protein
MALLIAIIGFRQRQGSAMAFVEISIPVCDDGR